MTSESIVKTAVQWPVQQPGVLDIVASLISNDFLWIAIWELWQQIKISDHCLKYPSWWSQPYTRQFSVTRKQWGVLELSPGPLPPPQPSLTTQSSSTLVRTQLCPSPQHCRGESNSITCLSASIWRIWLLNEDLLLLAATYWQNCTEEIQPRHGQCQDHLCKSYFVTIV